MLKLIHVVTFRFVFTHGTEVLLSFRDHLKLGEYSIILDLLFTEMRR